MRIGLARVSTRNQPRTSAFPKGCDDRCGSARMVRRSRSAKSSGRQVVLKGLAGQHGQADAFGGGLGFGGRAQRCWDPELHPR